MTVRSFFSGLWRGLDGLRKALHLILLLMIFGVVVGVLLYLYERLRDRYLAERLRTIALMNHHVRNALQAIKYARYSKDDVRVIEQAVARIEWALREILPANLPHSDKKVAAD